MQEEAVVEDCRFVPREIAFLKFLDIQFILQVLNYINILRIIFKINGKLYQKLFKNIIVSRLLDALIP